MSSAFVREQDGGRWEAPVVSAYVVTEAGDPQALRQGDDLLRLLHWMQTQDGTALELRDRRGLLLARCGR